MFDPKKQRKQVTKSHGMGGAELKEKTQSLEKL